MTASANDPSLALAAVSQQDLVQRKQNIDALRERLGDNKSKEQALRESCEGFESIFLQKMWEQMRKNVPKEGYLHSKDEEMYQSLFDVELCKKMTTAGGIGLADMLYEQLSQQLVNTGRTTSPSTYRPPVIPPTTSAVLAANKAAEEAVKAEPKPVLTVENLYAPLEEKVVTEEVPEESPITQALAEFAKIVKESPESTKIEPGRIVSGAVRPEDLPIIPANADAQGNEPVKGENIQAASWQSLGRVSATPRPVSKFNRPRNTPDKENPVSGTATITTMAAMPGMNTGLQTNPAGQGMRAGNGVQAGQISQNNQANQMNQMNPSGSSNHSSQVSQVSQVNRPEVLMAQGPGAPDTTSAIASEGEDNGILPNRAFWPVEGKVRTPFGWYEGADAQRNWNPGIFIDARTGDRVAACMEGEIVYNGEAEGFDSMVILDHGENYRSYYGNVAMHGLDVGDSVQGGMLFASVSTPDQNAVDAAKSSAFYFGLKRGDMALNPELAIPRFLTAQR